MGHATAALTRTSDVDWRRIEQVMDHLCRTLGMCVLCQYDARHTSGPRLDWAVGLHPDAIRGDAMELRPRGARLYLTGELDVGFAEPLMLGLRLACARQPGPSLMMDLSGLTFLDVVGARAVLLGTREFRKAGGLVSLLDPQPSVRRLLSLLRIEEQDRVLVA